MNSQNVTSDITDITDTSASLAATVLDTSAAPEDASFPFSDIVGLQDAKLALLLSTIEPAIGGVLLRGEKGSGKTTLARGLANLLGPNTPYVNLPLGATEDRIVGNIDLSAALTENNIKFSPGLFAQANGGVLYVDEVNLLADHIVDTLLDVAVSGVNRVEREGISHTHPAEFVLVGSMNPEEGELRPQLLDRFGLCVDTSATQEIDERVEAVTRRLRFDSAPTQDVSQERDDLLHQRLIHATPALLDANVIKLCCELAVRFDVEGLRTDLVLAHAAAAFAGYEGRTTTLVSDVKRVAPLALAHRGRKSMFDSAYYPTDQINEIVNEVASEDNAVDGDTGTYPSGPKSRPDGASESGQDDTAAQCAVQPLESGDLDEEHAESHIENLDQPNSGLANSPSDAEASIDTQEQNDQRQSDQRQSDEPENQPQHDDEPNTGKSNTGKSNTGESNTGESKSLAPKRSLRPPSMLDSDQIIVPPLPPINNRRDNKQSNGSARGRTIGNQPLNPKTSNPVAVAATVRNLAARRSSDLEAKLTSSDLRETVRKATASTLLIFAVDTSGSMGAQSRLEATVGAIRSLLTNAYQNRNRVALVTFQGTDAKVVLSPTSSVEVANLRLGNITTGGPTPLAAGLEKALTLANDRRYADRDRSIILLTDGRATGAPNAVKDAQTAAQAICDSGTPSLVLDCENTFPRIGLAEELATTMNASYVQLEDVTSDAVTSSVRKSGKIAQS